MGNSSYDSQTRSVRSAFMGYETKSAGEIFTQRTIHELMDPKKITIRECRDSETHPNVVPVLLFLDETGSMGKIPHALVQTGLPTLMGGLIEQGADISLLFSGVGDAKSDRCPLQVGQFESGDAELDLWLTRLYLEGNGGGNGGESYNLAWHFASNYVVTDAWEKRGQKGFLFTVGDEPVHNEISGRCLQEIYGKPMETVSTESILKAAQEKFNVYHLHITHSEQAVRALAGWRALLGESCIEVPDYRKIPEVITKILVSENKGYFSTPIVPEETMNTMKKTEEVVEML